MFFSDKLKLNVKFFTTLIFVVFVFFFVSLNEVLAADLVLSPQTGVYNVNTTFTTQVRINSGGKPINAAEGLIKFDPQKIQVLSISKGTMFTLWTLEPTFSNMAGTLTFGGGSPTGFNGSSGVVFTISYKALTAGNAKVSFSSGSILAHDGKGSNILSSMIGADYTIVANAIPATPEVIEYIAPANTPALPQIKSTTHSDPGQWYKNSTVELSWHLPADISAVRTLLDSESVSIPTKVYESPISSITLSDLEEGVSYFHLQFKNKEGWGKVVHFRLATDYSKPTKFEISLASESDLANPSQTLKLDIEDSPSGVNRYQVQIDGSDPYEYIDEEDTKSLSLPELEPGHHTVIIEAFDKAGNSLISTFSFAILAFDKPQFIDYPTEINSQVIPVIKGVTRPESLVTIFVKKLNSDLVSKSFDIKSDASGLFTFIPDSRFENGIYELTAFATDKNGAKSDLSNAIKIAVQDSGFIKIGSMVIGFLSVLIPLLAMLLLVILGILFFVRKIKIFKTFVIKETNEAILVLDSEFVSLASTVEKEALKLAESRKTKKLSKAETEMVEILKNALKTSKQKILKEVSDVDDIVD